MKIQLKFIIITILSAAVMLGLSTFFHALILHDFQGFLLTFTQLVIGLSIVYLSIATLLIVCISWYWNYYSLLTAILFSSAVGIFLYILATLLGHTLNDSHTTSQLLIDVVWQMIEQGAGGFIVYSLLSIGYKNIE
ncbi:MAG: hypothetical protein H7331_06615 [Bacteroidia bacterium]|nr:hypothetical protein [Bacteroidia bacterium]